MRRVALLGLVACAHAAASGVAQQYGRAKAQAIEVCYPPGEQDYLGALRCPDGRPVRAERLGSVGTRNDVADPSDPRLLEQMDAGRPLAPGEPDLHIIDAFRIRCLASEELLYFDMYHCPTKPSPAPQGYTLEP